MKPEAKFLCDRRNIAEFRVFGKSGYIDHTNLGDGSCFKAHASTVKLHGAFWFAAVYTRLLCRIQVIDGFARSLGDRDSAFFCNFVLRR